MPLYKVEQQHGATIYFFAETDNFADRFIREELFNHDHTIQGGSGENLQYIGDLILFERRELY
ncbi:MAG: hypothetical protein AB2L11_07325 [Syntrophobacteraceae bacterium]